MSKTVVPQATRRLSKAGLTAFNEITGDVHWALQRAQKRALLGGIPGTTYDRLCKAEHPELNRDSLERVSHVLAIYKALHIMFPGANYADRWVKEPNTVFNGGRALDTMLAGFTGLVEVRKYPTRSAGGNPRRLDVIVSSGRRTAPPDRYLRGTELVPSHELPALLEIEALTNPRLLQIIGPISAIPESDRVTGPVAAYVMAPFAYVRYSRFSDGTSGVYYAAKQLDTAIAEKSYHRALFLAATPTPPMDLDERIIEADLDANLVDLRELPMSDPIYDSTDYTASQAQARGARTAGADGIAYCSIRRPGGACVAVFRPRLVRNAITAGFIGLRWDGAKIIDAFRKASLTTTYP